MDNGRASRASTDAGSVSSVRARAKPDAATALMRDSERLMFMSFILFVA